MRRQSFSSMISVYPSWWIYIGDSPKDPLKIAMYKKSVYSAVKAECLSFSCKCWIEGTKMSDCLSVFIEKRIFFTFLNGAWAWRKSDLVIVLVSLGETAFISASIICCTAANKRHRDWGRTVARRICSVAIPKNLYS